MIEELKNQSRVHLVYKSLQRVCNIYYPSLMLCVILILSIMSSTLFSLGYILALCYLMLNMKKFLEVDKAREGLLPLFMYFFVPYMMFELFMILLYQVPVPLFALEDFTRIAKVLGVEKYYIIDANLLDSYVSSDASLSQLWCKAFAFFLISL